MQGNKHLIFYKMKTIYKISIFLLLASATFCSCSKKDTPKPTPTPTADISVLATNWVTNQWGGVAGNYLIFTIDKITFKGTVDDITGDGYGFTVSTVIYSDIKPNGDGTYSCSGSYNPLGTDGLSSRAATMSLQNNNTQLTVYYPAINSSYPAITYIYQQTNATTVTTL
jgi:hypothetical protein